MTKRTSINFLAVVQISVLGVFLLMAPCSMRHAVQAFLNIEKTEVSNLSKSTFHENENCFISNQEIDNNTSQNIIGFKTPHLPKGLTPAPQTGQYIEFQLFYISKPQLPTFQKKQIPLYILYQSFRSFIG